VHNRQHICWYQVWYRALPCMLLIMALLCATMCPAAQRIAGEQNGRMVILKTNTAHECGFFSSSKYTGTNTVVTPGSDNLFARSPLYRNYNAITQTSLSFILTLLTTTRLRR